MSSSLVRLKLLKYVIITEHPGLENMHYFVAEVSDLNLGTVSGFLKQAETIYEENLNAYVKIVLRRPFGKIIVSLIHALI